MAGSISDEGVLKKLLQQMNSQLPSRRVRLSELLRMPEPHYSGKDGHEYAFSMDELRFVKESLVHLGLDDVRLPIILMADSSHEQSVWRVEGETECALISHILGKSDREPREKIFLYGPHVAMLRRKIPTTTICMFMP